MKILSFLLLTVLTLSLAQANEVNPYGLQCAGVSSTDLRNCLKKEASKIDEANLPNEVILSTHIDGKKALIDMVEELTRDRTDTYALELAAKLPMIRDSVATALIIQYEDEPQLYYYIVDKDGKLEVIFDGLNSVDISDTFSDIFRNAPDTFSLHSSAISDNFKEWMKHLKENN